ncbi:hypothetical protein AC578_9863 [Pseudocercospora eumusae]|uniref:Uncharacterized protein n=1 Tax=Pseudocercospora eumusae TaxID=321146 RepID=A0A139HB54_9PEZI|nr:hypothetical protein AC578_9863 [Pseudocercospora eumusae]
MGTEDLLPPPPPLKSAAKRDRTISNQSARHVAMIIPARRELSYADCGPFCPDADADDVYPSAGIELTSMAGKVKRVIMACFFVAAIGVWMAWMARLPSTLLVPGSEHRKSLDDCHRFRIPLLPCTLLYNQTDVLARKDAVASHWDMSTWTCFSPSIWPAADASGDNLFHWNHVARISTLPSIDLEQSMKQLLQQATAPTLRVQLLHVSHLLSHADMTLLPELGRAIAEYHVALRSLYSGLHNSNNRTTSNIIPPLPVPAAVRLVRTWSTQIEEPLLSRIEYLCRRLAPLLARLDWEIERSIARADLAAEEEVCGHLDGLQDKIRIWLDAVKKGSNDPHHGHDTTLFVQRTKVAPSPDENLWVTACETRIDMLIQGLRGVVAATSETAVQSETMSFVGNNETSFLSPRTFN